MLVVVWSRPETDVPKRLGESAVSSGCVSTNWMPESGVDSAVASENVPFKPGSAGDQVGGAGRRIEAGCTDQDLVGLAGVDEADRASEEPARSPALAPVSVADGNVVGILARGIVPVRKAARGARAP